MTKKKSYEKPSTEVVELQLQSTLLEVSKVEGGGTGIVIGGGGSDSGRSRDVELDD